MEEIPRCAWCHQMLSDENPQDHECPEETKIVKAIIDKQEKENLKKD